MVCHGLAREYVHVEGLQSYGMLFLCLLSTRTISGGEA